MERKRKESGVIGRRDGGSAMQERWRWKTVLKMRWMYYVEQLIWKECVWWVSTGVERSKERNMIQYGKGRGGVCREREEEEEEEEDYKQRRTFRYLLNYLLTLLCTTFRKR